MTISTMIHNVPTRSCCGMPANQCQCHQQQPASNASYGVAIGVDEHGNPKPTTTPVGGVDQQEIFERNWQALMVRQHGKQPAPSIVHNQHGGIAGEYITMDDEMIGQRPEPLWQPEWQF